MKLRREKHSKKGSVLILMLIILPPLALFAFSKISLLLHGSQKITAQKNLDKITLELAQSQAQALNAIVAYNIGLRKARQQAHIFSIALLTARLCSLSFYASAPCLKAWAKLQAEAGPFFKKLKKLVNDMAQKQDELKSWAENQITSNLLKDPLLISIPDQQNYSLNIYRENESPCKEKPEKQDESCFGQGNDILKCNELHIDEFEIASRQRQLLKKHDTMIVRFKEQFNGSISEETYKYRDSKIFKPYVSVNSKKYLFASAQLTRCVSLHDTLSKIGKLVPVGIKFPELYVLGPEYRNKIQRVSFAKASSQKTALDEVFNGVLKNPYQTWVYSEFYISGANPLKMEFDSHLSKTTQIKKLNEKMSTIKLLNFTKKGKPM